MRIWSENLQLPCVQHTTSLQIWSIHHGWDCHHLQDGHHLKDGHHGRHRHHGVMVFRVIKVITTDRTTRTHGTDRTEKIEKTQKTGQTDLTFKLDFTGHLCRAAFVVLAMFYWYMYCLYTQVLVRVCLCVANIDDILNLILSHFVKENIDYSLILLNT